MLGFEVSPVVQYVIAFAIIAILLALFAIVLKRIGGKRFAMGGERGRGRQPRLGLVDVYDLDRQRQLVLLRRDNVEHLVMLGGPNDCVIESNIVRAPHGRAMTPPATEIPFERAPEQAIPAQTTYQPSVSQGVPPHAAVSMAAAPVAAAATAQSAAPEASAASTGVPAPTPEPAPQPMQGGVPIQGTEAPAPPIAAPEPEPAGAQPRSHPAAEAKPEPRRGLFGFGQPRETQAAEKPAPQFPPRPRTTPVAPDNPPPYPPRRTAPNLSDTPPQSTEAPGIPGKHDSASAEPVEPPSAAPKREPAAASAAGEDALLSDMARELEAAFKRPASGPPGDMPSARPEPPIDTPRDTQRDSAPDPETPNATLRETPAFPARNAPQLAKTQRPPGDDAFSPEEALAKAAHGKDGPTESLRTQTSSTAPSSAGNTPDTASSETMPVGHASDNHPSATSLHAPAPGMTPAPTSGPAHFATAIEESPQPQAPLPADVPAESETPAARHAGTDEPAASSTFALAQEMMAEEALDDTEARLAETSIAPSPSTEEARPQTGPEIAAPDESAEPGSTPTTADNRRDAPTPVHEEAFAHDTPPEQGTPEEQAAGEIAVAEQPQGEPVQQKEEPARTVDPFSVDEIEAEFARLLGRSAEQESKSS